MALLGEMKVIVHEYIMMQNFLKKHLQLKRVINMGTYHMQGTALCSSCIYIVSFKFDNTLAHRKFALGFQTEEFE